MRFFISYRGIKSTKVEGLISSLGDRCGLKKAGDWSYSDSAFQCLFLARRKEQVENFNKEVRNHKELSLARIQIFPPF